MIKIKIKQVFAFLRDKIFTRTLFDIVFTLFFVYCVINDSIRGPNFLYSLFFLTLVTIYKYCLHLFLNNLVDTQKNTVLLHMVVNSTMKTVVKYVKNQRYIVAIYYVLRYFPTNGPYFIILAFIRTFIRIRLGINSNKDIIAKRFFTTNTVSWYPKASKVGPNVKRYFKPFVRVFWYPTYLKVNLLSLPWESYFRIKVVAIMYSAVLLANNMHFVTGFKHTEYMTLPMKLIIVFLVMYIYFFYLPRIMFNKEYTLSKALAIGMATARKEAFVTNKVFLLFMLLSWHYARYIDETHNLFLTKYTGKTAPLGYKEDLPKFLFELGFLHVVSMKQDLEYPFLVAFHIKASQREIIGKYDKNYFLPLLVNIHTVVYSDMLSNYPKVIIYYELLKQLNGDMYVQQGLGDAIQEYEDFIFILRAWTAYVKNCWDLPTLFKNNSDDIIFDNLPSKINSNGIYYKNISTWSTLYSFSYCQPFGKNGNENVSLLLADIMDVLPDDDFSIDNFKSYLLNNKEDLNTPLSQLRITFYARKPYISSRFGRMDAKVHAHIYFIDHIFNEGAEDSTPVSDHIDKLLVAHKLKYCVYQLKETKTFVSSLKVE